MLSKRFYDILSLVFILLVVISFYFSFTLSSNVINDAVENAFSGNTFLTEITNIVNNDDRVIFVNYLISFTSFS